MALVALLFLGGLLPVQDDSPVAPSPPPDQYDDEHDALLFGSWGWELGSGPRDPGLEPQPAPLRPREWILFSTPTRGDRDSFVLDHIVRRRPFPSAGEQRSATMPERGPLVGEFSHALAFVDSSVEEVRFLRAPGADTVFVNGEPFVGDRDRRGWLGVPVLLRKGRNTLVVAGVGDAFELDLWKPVTRMVMASWAVQVPGEDKNWPNRHDLLYVPVFNAANSPADKIHFHYGDAGATGEVSGIDEWSGGGFAPPLAIIPRMAPLFGIRQEVPAGPEVRAPLVAFHRDDPHADRRLLSLPTAGPRPRWPVRQKRTWPEVPQVDQLLFTTCAFVVEGSDDDEFHSEALAAARYFQQRLWERGGELVPVSSQVWLDWRDTGFQDDDWVVQFGRLDEGEPGLLWAGPEPRGEDGPATFALRASDAAGMRLSYVIDPFFRSVDPSGESWSVR